jgi:hypothetical protein
MARAPAPDDPSDDPSFTRHVDDPSFTRHVAVRVPGWGPSRAPAARASDSISISPRSPALFSRRSVLGLCGIPPGVINCFVVKVCIKEIQSQALRVAKAINAVIAVSPENSERLSQFLLLLATTLKIAVIAHKDDRITRCSSPLKAIDRVNAAGELLKTWASLMSDELIISSGSLLQVMWQREGAGAVWSNPSAQQEFQTRYRRAQSLVKSRLQCMSSMQQTLREVKQVFLIKSCEVAAWCRNCNIHDMTYLTKTLGPGAQPQGVCAVPVPRRSWQPRLGRVASQWGCCRPWHRLNTYSAGHCQRSTRRLISVPEHCALKCPAKLARQSWNTFLNLSSTCGIVRRAA